jgi:hypothetical protein
LNQQVAYFGHAGKLIGPPGCEAGGLVVVVAVQVISSAALRARRDAGGFAFWPFGAGLYRRFVQSSRLLAVVVGVVVPLQLRQHFPCVGDRKNQFIDIFGFEFAYLIEGKFSHVDAIAKPVFKVAESLAVPRVKVSFGIGVVCLEFR